MSAPITLDQLGDVLTDAQLAQLLQRSPQWPKRERRRARLEGVAPNLPATIPHFANRPRYRKVDVARWLMTGSARRGSL